MRRPTRRGVLIGTAAIVATGAAASALACRPRVQDAALDPGRLRVVLAHIHAPERVGRAYRLGRDTGILLAELEARAGLCEVAAASCPEAARAALRVQVAEDFRRGDVVVADRLVMARSECILAALVA